MIKKKDESYIKYFKAWNATFEYKGFNLDMNNDIALNVSQVLYIIHMELKKKTHMIIYIQFIKEV